MMAWQKQFLRTGQYPCQSSAVSGNSVYDNQEYMASYMTGLALSQFLWPSHYEIYRFFTDCLGRHGSGIGSYLEIGPGHGLFLRRSLEFLNDDVTINVVDISRESIEITRSLIQFFYPERHAIEFHTMDILDFNPGRRFGFITMGEVLEHVADPETLLKKLSLLAESGGHVFISTCINCPAIDHLYHFRSVSEVREMIQRCGFEIEKDLILPVEELSMDEIIKQKITINYCAILKKRG
jgi:SAM-dependent methyltransferase